MKSFRALAVVCACSLGLVLAVSAQGPNDTGSETVARPKKKADPAKPGDTTTPPPTTDLPKIPSQYNKKDAPPVNIPTFSTDATTVTVDVAVMDNKGHPIPKLGKQYFRILEDNVPQQIISYSVGEAPMTICLVVEFSNRFQQVYGETWYQTIQAAYTFTQMLKPEDYLAIVAYDLKPEMLSDFTTDRAETADALQRLRFPGFSEANLYDALTDTIDRMQGIEGRKAILLLSSGVDTFSKQTFDKARRAIQEGGVPIYSVGLMQSLRDRAEASGRLGGMQELDFLQADNQLRTFSTETGGMAFFPHFVSELPGIYQAVSQAMRSQYVLAYNPSNTTRDGKFRKIKVELVDPATNQPLKITDEKQKPLKYSVIAKGGYKAPRAIE
ncbi:MAG TPA: VWA domain-containing protein [Bryobacteraceae bacterium]